VAVRSTFSFTGTSRRRRILAELDSTGHIESDSKKSFTVGFYLRRSLHVGPVKVLRRL